MRVTLVPSETGDSSLDENVLSYTGTPSKLVLRDLGLIWKNRAYALTGVIFPWKINSTDKYDELYLKNWRNIRSIATHFLLLHNQVFIIIFVLVFGLSPVPILPFPVAPFWYLVWFFGVLGLNKLICLSLNGPLTVYPTKEVLEELRREGDVKKFENEYWVYLNGVSIGHDWLQSNVDRLSLTFRRPVVGVHNPTSGILFDLIQCLVQRNFTYSTQDVREAYAQVKQALLKKKGGKNEDAYNKVVFILHSQGGIEGGLAINWLLDELPQDTMNKLEVYTFGNAANHFSNPQRSRQWIGPKTYYVPKAIRYIEHYANHGDFVSRFGVLNFVESSNNFMGRVFISPNGGHLLCQHYLHDMFTLDPATNRVLDHNDFMDAEIEWAHTKQEEEFRESLESSIESSSNGNLTMARVPLASSERLVCPVDMRKSWSSANGNGDAAKTARVRDFSRLWYYRNGGSPPSVVRSHTI